MPDVKRTLTIAAVGVAAFLADPSSAVAQVPGVGLDVVPKVGVYFAASDLPQIQDQAARIVDEREASLGVGLALELSVPVSPINFRANADYVTGSTVTTEDGGGIERDVESTLLNLTGDLVFRPLPRLVVLQPYLLAGAGVKRYDFDTEDATGGVDEAFPEDETDFTLHAGAGLDLGLGPLALVIEASDYISWFEPEGGDESEIQHDVFGMVGIRVGLF